MAWKNPKLRYLAQTVFNNWHLNNSVCVREAKDRGVYYSIAQFLKDWQNNVEENQKENNILVKLLINWQMLIRVEQKDLIYQHPQKIPKDEVKGLLINILLNPFTFWS